MFKVDTQTKKLNRVVEIVDSCMGTSKTTNILKWIWRGCIRKGEPMFVAIGSKRMYNLFVDWLNDEFEGAV